MNNFNQQIESLYTDGHITFNMRQFLLYNEKIRGHIDKDNIVASVDKFVAEQMPKNALSKFQFCAVLRDAEKLCSLDDNISNVVNNTKFSYIDKDFMSSHYSCSLPIIIALLETMYEMADGLNDISYYCCECCFGKEHRGANNTSRGIIVSFERPEEVYDLIAIERFLEGKNEKV